MRRVGELLFFKKKNTASYKFALAKALLEIDTKRAEVSLKELAVPFSLYIARHLIPGKVNY